MPELRDATVIIGIPGLDGGGITAVQLTTGLADRAPASSTYITTVAEAGLTNEFALSTMATGLVKVTNGTGVLTTAVGGDLPPHTTTGVITAATYLIDGGGATITTGIKGDLLIPFAATITAVTVLADQTGSIQFTVWKDTYANYPPVIGDLFFTTTITSANKLQATGLSYVVATGDILRFNVVSATTIQRISIILTMTRSV